MEILPLIVIGAGIVIALVFSHYAEKKRRQQLGQLCKQYGLNFDNSRDYNLDTRFGSFDCLLKGSNRYGYNRILGQWHGRYFLGFDYHYETYSYSRKGGRRTHNHYFSGIIISGNVILKDLFIRPEWFLDKFTELIGFDDIDFESAEFSRKFYVKAKEKKWAFDIIHQKTMEFLLSKPQFTMQFHGRNVIAYHNRKFNIEEFESAADVVTGVLDLIPDYVLKEQSSGGI